jgi:hypothetical protein
MTNEEHDVQIQLRVRLQKQKKKYQNLKKLFGQCSGELTTAQREN